ncbi:MAG: diguanylate cyclase domain-containing protein [Geodermatophilaceae bacterium]
MDDSFAEVIRLLRLAQTGEREQALILADEQLRAGESPGVLYARAVTLHSLGDHDGAARSAERMLGLTAGTEMTGWRSIALALRAWQHLLLIDTNGQLFDLESILHDLAEAEAMVSDGVFDGFVLSTAHTCLGNGYHELRLYELARPNFEAAFAAATARPDEIVVNRAVSSQLNLATMHLNWSMELHRIGDSGGSREKSVIAARHAAMAQEYATTDDTQSYADHAGLLLACAVSSFGNEGREAEGIRDALKVLEGRGLRETRGYALPFLARALGRVGQHTEALEVATQAISALPADATWMVASAAYHTQATLLVESGSDSARAALAYGDQLAETMWRQRLRTLHDVRARQFVERVTQERDRIQVLANTDALTGVGNRRAFDVRIAELAASDSDSAEVALIVVDVDRLKAVNDAGGHEAGDRALQAVAGALTSQVRAGDLVARLGGDEFVAVLVGMDRAAAGEVAQRMVDAVSAALSSTVTVSLGVATGPAAEAGSSLLRAADRAMYAAKRSRRVVMTGSQPVVADQSRTG